MNQIVARLLMAAGITALAAAGCGPGLRAGTMAPDFTMDNLAGDKVSLSDYRGKVVLLSFWGVG